MSFFLSLLLYIPLAVLVVVLVLVAKLLGGMLRYALFGRFGNKELMAKIPSIGVFTMFAMRKHGGIEQFIDDLRKCSTAGENTFPPLVNAGTSRTGRQQIVVCSAEGLKQVFNDVDVFEKSPEMYKSLGPMLGEGLATSEGQTWHDQRKRLTPMFHLSNLRSYTPMINEEGRALVEKLAHLADGGKTEIADLPPIFADTALNVIARAVFGERLDIARVGRLWSTATIDMGPYFLTLMAFPAWSIPFLPFRKPREFLACCAELDALFSDVIDECRAHPEDATNASFDLVAQMALLKNESGDWEIPKKLIVDECKTFTFAAQDTTSNLLSWTVFLLGRAENAHLQEQLVAESREVCGADPAADVAEPEKLKLHRAALTEALRLVPPVPTLSRRTTVDTVLCGHKVEADTFVITCMAAPQLSAEHYAEPLAYKPERWLDGSLANRHPFAFLAFSAGSRNCIGQKLSLNEATILLSHVLRRFRFQVTNPSEVVMQFKGTAEPHGMKVRFFDRT
jgi:cytochrome P450